MERKFQLQHVELPDAISQLSSPADYRAAGMKLKLFTSHTNNKTVGNTGNIV